MDAIDAGCSVAGNTHPVDGGKQEEEKLTAQVESSFFFHGWFLERVPSCPATRHVHQADAAQPSCASGGRSCSQHSTRPLLRQGTGPSRSGGSLARVGAPTSLGWSCGEGLPSL